MRRFVQLLILAALLILVLPIFLPKTLNAEVEKEFELPVGILFEEFNNLKEYSEWDPWSSKDSLTQQDFFAPYRGVGAAYKWHNNENTGEITITKSQVNKSITYDLKGLDLDENSTMNVDFTSINSNKSKVKWTISNDEIGYFSRYYSYFTSKNLTENMNIGLGNLVKNLKNSTLTSIQAESLVPGDIKTEAFEGLKLITLVNETSLEQDEITTAREESFGLLFSYLTDHLKISSSNIGNPISYYEFIDTATGKAKFHCGYALTESAKLGEGMEFKSIPAGKTLVCIHKGSYATIASTLDKMKSFAKTSAIKLENSHWEEYQNDPEIVKNQDDLRTKIFIPILN